MGLKKASILPVQLLMILASASCFLACSHSRIKADQLYSGSQAQKLDPQTLIQSVKPGAVVIIGEDHTNRVHHQNQLDFAERVAALYPQNPTYIAIEHFPYTAQKALEAYEDGLITEDVFLQTVDVPASFFAYYRPLVKSQPRPSNLRVLAINIPRKISKKVGQSGVQSLSAMDKSLLPPNYSLGRPEYIARATEYLQMVHPAESPTLQNYLWAQSLWDDTMAWRIAMQMQLQPLAIVIVAVGNFHVEYGGGLPDRLRARGMKNVISVVQANVANIGAGERKKAVYPHAKWGERAQYVWTTGY